MSDSVAPTLRGVVAAVGRRLGHRAGPRTTGSRRGGDLGPSDILYVGVQDLGYPRNLRLRRYLADQGDRVTVVPLDANLPKLARWARALGVLLKHGRGADVYLLAEFSNKFAALLWLWAKLNGGRLVVDGFVGLHETRVDDWQEVSATSMRARWYRGLDLLALRLSDVYLIDTEVRAEAIRADHPGAVVVSLPVGAPSWATVVAPERTEDLPQVLFYGNYLPLHGTDLIVAGVAEARRSTRFELTMIGSGRGREQAEALVQDLDLEGVVTFVDALPEVELAQHVRRADLVLGVFGASLKARSVIPNKVWQGLACGKPVVTQRSPALDEVSGIVGDQLVQVLPEPAVIGRAIVQALVKRAELAARPTHELLEEHVARRFATEVAILLGRSPSGVLVSAADPAAPPARPERRPTDEVSR